MVGFVIAGFHCTESSQGFHMYNLNKNTHSLKIFIYINNESKTQTGKQTKQRVRIKNEM